MCEPKQAKSLVVFSSRAPPRAFLLVPMTSQRCAFTSNQSTYDGRCFADCAGNKGAWAFLHCDACEPEQHVFRCTACYHKFQLTLLRRLTELEKHQRAKVVGAPELAALLAQACCYA